MNESGVVTIPSKRDAADVAKLLLSIDAVTFRFNPPYTFTSGIKSPIYLDNRLVMSFPYVRKKIINYYMSIIRKNIGVSKIKWISGTASAAIPQAAWVSEKLNLPMVYVRPTTKTYGKGNQIEGYLKKGSEALIIEDHVSTGNSVVENVKTLRKAGCRVKHCIATTTYETKKARQLFIKNKIKFHTLTTGKIIVETAYQQRKLDKEQKRLVDLWFEDPVNWAKKVG